MIYQNLEKKLEAKNNKEYKVKTIINSGVYSQETNDQIRSFYYFVL